MVLNLPLAHACFKLFRMSPAAKRNHALEHGTISILHAQGLVHMAGRADEIGFRIAGASEVQIHDAFAQVRARVAAGEPFAHISRRCGSNRLTALGLGVLLLAASILVALVFEPPLIVRSTMVVSVALVAVFAQHVVGNWAQGRYFMLTDFSDVAIRHIRKVPARVIEWPPAFHVQTRVR